MRRKNISCKQKSETQTACKSRLSFATVSCTGENNNAT